MELRRRQLMAGFGVALTSFLTLGCGLKRPTPIVTCYAALPPPTPEPSPSPAITCYTVVPGVTVTPTVVVQADADWQRLRSLWLDLDTIASNAGDDELGPQVRDEYIAEHQTALDHLVDRGVLDTAVAADMQTAYSEAAFHVWRQNSNITCYVPAPPPDYYVASRAELVTQAQVLEEMATEAALNSDTVAEARAAIERDIAYMAMSGEEQQALAERIIAEMGSGGEYPDLGETGLEVPPSSAEAARALVRLLLGQGNAG